MIRDDIKILREAQNTLSEALISHGIVSPALSEIATEAVAALARLSTERSELIEITKHAAGNLRRHGLEQSAKYIEEQLAQLTLQKQG